MDLPVWLLDRDEKTINSCMAFKLGGISRDVGIPDIDWNNGWWSPAKKNLQSQGEYDSLRGEIERYPKDISILVLIYGSARKDLLNRLNKILPKGSSVKVFGTIEDKVHKTYSSKSFSYKSYAKGLKSFLEVKEVGGCLEPQDNLVCLKVSTPLKAIYYYFHLFSNRIRLGFGTNGTRSVVVLRKYKDKIGNPQLWLDTPGACGFHREIKVDGYYKNPDDWRSFWDASYLLYTQMEEEIKLSGLLKELGADET